MLIQGLRSTRFKVEDWRYEIKFKRRRRDIRSTSIKKKEKEKKEINAF